MFEDTFSGVKKNFGFGCMRLKLTESGEVDFENFKAMIDSFMANGFNYFDTAHGYINYKSETAIRECLVKRYPRESYILTNKLSEGFFNSEDEIIPLFESQLAACGVDYFDYYLMHAQNKAYFEKYQRLNAYDTVLRLKAQGRVRHMGISFHDSAEVLDMILSERPEIEVVQLQFNYLDYDDDRVESRKCYEVCVKHNKPVIVMEPIKGGSLVNLPSVAQEIYDRLGSCSNAGIAIRFAAGFENVKMVLSGMNDTVQMKENIELMKNFQPLNEDEQRAVREVTEILKNQAVIPCTACEYCVNDCPANIIIPKIFSAYNKSIIEKGFDFKGEYAAVTADSGSADNCIKCGRCEHICPQKLEIRKLLEDINKNA